MSDEESSVDTPWGKIKGLSAIVVVLLAAALAGAGYLLFDRTQNDRALFHEQHQDQQERSTTEHKAIVDSVGALRDATADIGAVLEEQNYIILMDEEERKQAKKKLRMPRSLREKMGSE